MITALTGRPLFEGSDWTFETLRSAYAAIEEIALDDLGLDIYPNQIEIVSAEQMLDAYSSIGMPLMYRHWSFGKRFAREEILCRKGYTGLAYEIVINSNPCISYNMEESTMAMQTLVMAHAAFGHNHFFKNNYLYRQWTDADAILQYLEFAKAFIAKCEERHGVAAVEEILDAAHALMDQSVFRYRRPRKLTAEEMEERERLRVEYQDRTYRDLWRTVPQTDEESVGTTEELEATAAHEGRMKDLKLPYENLLYFIENNSPSLEPWQREILRIVRNIAQYFYPQKQTKVMNEGCATFVHYYVVNALYDAGRLDEGALLEILHSHSNVVSQPSYDDRRFGGLNPYALGFEMMADIKRICAQPTREDETWFPEFAGCDDWRAVLREAWANFRDESFIQQYLSPHLMRKLRLFLAADDAKDSHFTVSGIHDERGYREVRTALARTYDPGVNEPEIQVVDADLRGDRRLRLQQTVLDGVPLAEPSRDDVMELVRRLWGHEVSLVGIDADTSRQLYETSTD